MVHAKYRQWDRQRGWLVILAKYHEVPMQRLMARN
jgi:hypothetical protein